MASIDWRFEPYNTGATWPTGTGTGLLLGVGKSVCCVDQVTGDLIWETPTNGQITVRPSIAGESGFVVDTTGTIHSVDKRDGECNWSRDIAGNADVPTITDETAVITTTTQGIVSLDPDTGEHKWETRLPSSPPGPPAVTEEFVYTGTKDGVMYALSRESGTVLWQLAVQAPLTRAGLVIRNNTLYAPTESIHSDKSGTLYAIDQDSRDVKWTITTPPTIGQEKYLVSTPVIHNGTLFLISSDNRGSPPSLQAIRDGKEMWRSEVSKAVAFGPPVVTNNVLIAFCGSNLTGFDPSTGDKLWQVRVTDSLRAYTETLSHGAPVVTGHSIIVRGSQTLYAINAERELGTNNTTESIEQKDRSELGGLAAASRVTYPSYTSRVNGDVIAAWGFFTRDGILINPMLIDETLYFASYGGLVGAVDKADGRVDWVNQYDNRFRKCPLLADGTLYLVAKSQTYGLDPQDGTIQTRNATLPDEPETPTGTVAVSAENDVSAGFRSNLEKFVVTVGSTDASNEWQFDEEIPGYATIWDSYFGRIEDTVFVGLLFKPGSLVFYALDDGEQSIRWQVKGPGGGSDIFSPPILDGETLFFTCGNTVYAVRSNHLDSETIS